MPCPSKRRCSPAGEASVFVLLGSWIWALFGEYSAAGLSAVVGYPRAGVLGPCFMSFGVLTHKQVNRALHISGATKSSGGAGDGRATSSRCGQLGGAEGHSLPALL